MPKKKLKKRKQKPKTASYYVNKAANALFEARHLLELPDVSTAEYKAEAYIDIAAVAVGAAYDLLQDARQRTRGDSGAGATDTSKAIDYAERLR